MTTHFDLPLDELRDYRPDLAEPADLRDFWQTTLDEAYAHDIDVTWTPYESPLRTVDVFDVRSAGSAGNASRRGCCCRGSARLRCRASCNTSATAAAAACRTSG